MPRKVLVSIPRHCLDHLQLGPLESPRTVVWGRHVILLRPIPFEELEGMFSGLLSSFEREADRAV